MLHFSSANAKTKALYKCKELKQYLNKKKVYSLDLLSGHSCVGADKCLAKVILQNNKRKLVDGPNTEFRCFSASQEALFTNVYNLRKNNLDEIRGLSKDKIVDKILATIPKDAGVIRWNVSGDITSQAHFNAIVEVAHKCPTILFYAYTKSIPFWLKYLEVGILPTNLRMTASYGGKYDYLIDKHNLKSAKVVYSKYEAKKLGLKIDKTDELAASPKFNNSFALLIHGVQKANTKAAKAWQKIKNSDGGYH